MGFSSIFHWQLCRSGGLVFNKQLFRTFQVVPLRSSIVFWPQTLMHAHSVVVWSCFYQLHLFYILTLHVIWRWWRPLQLYAGFSIFLVYVYQLPVEYPSMLKWVAEFIGLFKISSTSEWPKICSYVSLILFYIMVSNLFAYFFLNNIYMYFVYW